MPHRTTPAAVHRANGFFTGMLEAAGVSFDLAVAAVECAPQVAAALDDPASVLSGAERRALTSGNGYFPYGLPELRDAIAGVLSTRHGISTTAGQVVVTTGGQQALDLLARCEVGPGQAAVVEDPTFPGMLDALHRAGARLVGVPPGDVARLAAAVAVHSPSLVYLIPTYQNPVGSVLPAAAREAVAALARRHPDVTFIDDMTLADVSLSDGDVPVPLAALAPDAPNIVTVGSLSKLYWGGLRVGWVRAPSGIVARLAAAKAAADLGSTAYHQGVVAAVVAGQHDAIVKWRAEWTRSRYDAVAAALRSFLPAWDWAPPSGGLTIWARLPGAAEAGAGAAAAGPAGADRAGEGPGSPDSSAFAQAALRRGVAIVPGRLLSPAGGGRSYLRLAFTPPPEQLTAAVLALASV